MPSPVTLDETSKDTNGLLDSLFGTLGKGVELWGAFKTKQVELDTAKAAIPATVSSPTPSVDSFGGVSTKTLLIIGGGLFGGLLLLLVVLRGRGK